MQFYRIKKIGILFFKKHFVNGFKFGPGEKFTDIKDKLGDEVKPSSSAMPCDPNAVGEKNEK